MLSNWQYPGGGIIPLPYHHTMLADENRRSAFQRAIERVVRPGDVVFDPGAGTGILSYFAAQKARKVYAVEADPAVAELGRRLIGLNHLTDRVDYQLGLAQDHLPTEPVDVVICEMMHVALAVEQQVPVLNAVRAGLAKRFPGHAYRVIPEGAVNYCQLLQASFDFGGFQAPFIRLGNTYAADPSLVPLSPLVPYLRLDFGGEVEPHIAARCLVVADAPGDLNAIRILTQAVVSFDQSLPGNEGLVDWYLHFLVLPLPASRPVQAGATFVAEFEYDAGCPLDQIGWDLRPA
ncbi:MAG: 50S ribosomal protein L11 methyltransferase [Chloroflexota bacterium]